MSRIFWDSMLFIYLIEGHPRFSLRVEYLLRRSLEREDRLFTSHLAVGEVTAGMRTSAHPQWPESARQTIDEFGLSYLPFGETAIAPFSTIRATTRIKTADAINLSCAAAAGIDLFLTGDKQLVGIDIPGIQFIAEFNSSIL
jgi:predicted nucleic acid-binding protein